MTQPMPPEPPSAPPPPPPPQPPPPTGAPSDNRNAMIALAYLWVLAVVPLMVEKDDPEVQWHAKHGLVLTVAEIILYSVLGVASFIPVLGCIIFIVPPIAFLGILVVRILAITKGMNGQRFTIPGVSDFVSKL